MRKRGERYFVLLPLLIVFACLLLTGGSRLIGRKGVENNMPAGVTVSLVRAALCASEPARAETGCAQQRSLFAGQQSAVISFQAERLVPRVCSDANGNVLGEETYLHAVYQAFALGDGFA